MTLDDLIDLTVVQGPSNVSDYDQKQMSKTVICIEKCAKEKELNEAKEEVFTAIKNITTPISTLKMIGSGGQATVYRGEWKGRVAAVKKYSKEWGTREIELLKMLKHENVVEFLGIVSLDGQISLMLEFCETTLRTVITNSEQAFGFDLFMKLSLGIAYGLAYLHDSANGREKVIHRDLKPENVLIAESNTPKLCDFGISKAGMKESAKMTIVGTTPYMAPELIKGTECNESIDVWAFGVILWEMISRKRPYASINDIVLHYAIGHGRVRLPIPSHCFESLSITLNRCWVPNHSDRSSIIGIIDLLATLEEEIDDHVDVLERKEVWSEQCEMFRDNADTKDFFDEVQKAAATEMKMREEASELASKSDEAEARLDKMITRQIKVLPREWRNFERTLMKRPRFRRHRMDPAEIRRLLNDREFLKWISRAEEEAILFRFEDEGFLKFIDSYIRKLDWQPTESDSE